VKFKVLDYLRKRELLNKELGEIMGHCDYSPIVNELETNWCLDNDELHLQVDDEPLEDNYYAYIVSSLSALGEELFMGERDGITYAMCYVDNWNETIILMLDNKNKIESND